MRCPKCNSQNLRVIASRKQDYKTFNHRFIICDDCHITFQTREEIIPDSITEVPPLFLNDKSPNQNK